MSDLVTGEAVVLGLRSAKLPSRAMAIALDLLVQFGGLVVTTLVLSLALTDLDGAAAAALMLGLTVFFLVAVPVMTETFSRGRSLGKLALGLRVVRTDGGPVRFRHALVRGLTGFFEIIVLTAIPATIASLVSPEGKRLGDLFAGTLVVRERVPGGRSGPRLPQVPPQLLQAMSGELVALDLSAVPESLWLSIRQLLGRVEQLDRDVADGLAARLAGDLAARTGHAVPYGLHPAVYLGAVLAERQRREWAKAQGYTAARQPQPAPYPAAPAPYAPQPQHQHQHQHQHPTAPSAAPAAPAAPAADGGLSPLTTAPVQAGTGLPAPGTTAPTTPPPAAPGTGFVPPA
ncbi:RDD family protein [Kitasatospora sp. NPDC054939]